MIFNPIIGIILLLYTSICIIIYPHIEKLFPNRKFLCFLITIQWILWIIQFIILYYIYN